MQQGSGASRRPARARQRGGRLGQGTAAGAGRRAALLAPGERLPGPNARCTCCTLCPGRRPLEAAGCVWRPVNHFHAVEPFLLAHNGGAERWQARPVLAPTLSARSYRWRAGARRLPGGGAWPGHLRQAARRRVGRGGGPTARPRHGPQRAPHAEPAGEPVGGGQPDGGPRQVSLLPGPCLLGRERRESRESKESREAGSQSSWWQRQSQQQGRGGHGRGIQRHPPPNWLPRCPLRLPRRARPGPGPPPLLFLLAPRPPPLPQRPVRFTIGLRQPGNGALTGRPGSGPFLYDPFSAKREQASRSRKLWVLARIRCRGVGWLAVCNRPEAVYWRRLFSSSVAPWPRMLTPGARYSMGAL